VTTRAVPALPEQSTAPVASGDSAAETAQEDTTESPAEPAQAAEPEVAASDVAEPMVMAEGESIEQFRERLRKSAAPKKSTISADMLDTANTYDDKVALLRLLVSEDSGRVANVLKTMIRLEGEA
jgi:flagellar M-ring protein FliF